MEHYRIIQGRALIEIPGNGRDITITEEYLTELGVTEQGIQT